MHKYSNHKVVYNHWTGILAGLEYIWTEVYFFSKSNFATKMFMVFVEQAL